MNISKTIFDKTKRKNHLIKNHPIEILKNLIFNYFKNFEKLDDLSPFVSIEDNFDFLRIPKEHPSRKLSDTYYLDNNTVLRTHCTCHIKQLVSSGATKYVVCGDVYRKDAIDSTHYPVFTQIDGFCLSENPLDDLKKTLSGLVEYLFPNKKYRFLDDEFPFTVNSLQIEVDFNGRWVEILGAGVVHQEIMDNLNLSKKSAWAFGLGIDRLAMIMFNIPDIRYFWVDDERFLSQFKNGGIIEFKPYSKYPPVYKDISLWLDEEIFVDGVWHKYNDICEIIRDLSNDSVEQVELIDEFRNKKTNKLSHCYRITFRKMDKTLTDNEVNNWLTDIRKNLTDKLNIELR